MIEAEPCRQLNIEFRDVVRTKLIWLTNLRRLDYLCAPNIPFGVDAQDLPYEQLRAIVVEALRIHKNVMAGEAQYRLRHRVKLDLMPGIRLSAHHRIIKLSPDGRYLFLVMRLLDTETPMETLQGYDLLNDGHCFWTLQSLGNITHLDLAMSPENGLLLAISDYDIGSHAPNSWYVLDAFPIISFSLSHDEAGLEFLKWSLPDGVTGSEKLSQLN